MSQDIEARKGGSLRPHHGVAAVVVAVVGVIVGFWVLTALAGLIWGIIKVGVIIALVVGVVYLLVGRRR
jgi:hypothetical protein